MNMKRWVLGALLCCVSGAFAGPFTFTQVSNSGDGFLDDYVAPAYNDNGEVAFWGSYAGNAESGIFSASAPANGVIGSLNSVVDTSGVYSSFTHGQVDINNSGHISFYSNLDGGGAGIFYYNGSTATAAFTTGTNWSDVGSSLSVGFFPQLNDSDQLTFSSQFPTKSGAFLWDGGTVTELARGGFGEAFNGFAHHIDINNSGLMIAQSQSGGWQTLVAMTTGGVDRWVNDGVNANPSGYPYFYRIGTTPVLNNNGLAAFSGVESIGSNTGLYLTDHNFISQVYNPLAGHSLNETFSINDQGTVLYIDNNNLTGHHTLFAYQNGITTEILKSGDLVDGKIVDEIKISSNALNNNDEMAIYASFLNGSNGVYVAGLSAIPEPASIFLLFGGTLAIWRRRRKVA